MASSSAQIAPNGRSKLASLTGMRFIAALSVFLFHSSISSSPVPPHAGLNPFADGTVAADYAFVLSHAGELGVSFFFVLSGFVLTWASKPGEPAYLFLRRRAVKIFPNHIVVWLVCLPLFAWSADSATALWSNLALVHDYFPQPAVNLSVNPPSWSLCSEVLFYALFPFLIGPLRRIPVRRLWFWAAAMIGGTVAVQLVNRFLIPGGTQTPPNPIPDLQFWFGYLFPPNRLFEFVLGAILARLVLAGKWPDIRLVPCGLLLVAGYVAALYVSPYYGFIVATIVPIGVLIASVANIDAQGRRTVFSGRVLVWLGNVSFAFYLCQGVTLFYVRSLFARTLFPTWAGAGVIIGLAALTVLAGALLHHLVEEPMMRRWSRPRPLPLVPAAPAAFSPAGTTAGGGEPASAPRPESEVRPKAS